MQLTINLYIMCTQLNDAIFVTCSLRKLHVKNCTLVNRLILFFNKCKILGKNKVYKQNTKKAFFVLHKLRF